MNWKHIREKKVKMSGVPLLARAGNLLLQNKKLGLKFKVCKSVHHRSIEINQPTRCNNFSSLLLLCLCTAQHVSGVLTPIIRSLTTAVAASGFTVRAW
jgi:hypothetical protein